MVYVGGLGDIPHPGTVMRVYALDPRGLCWLAGVDWHHWRSREDDSVCVNVCVWCVCVCLFVCNMESNDTDYAQHPPLSNQYDANGDGVLQLDEFKQLLHDRPETYSYALPEMVQRAFKRAGAKK